eukprot:Colp12_sorted_trinity150504_noHs@3324
MASLMLRSRVPGVNLFTSRIFGSMFVRREASAAPLETVGFPISNNGEESCGPDPKIIGLTRFPCMDKLANMSAGLGPEPQYELINKGFKLHKLDDPYETKNGGVIPEVNIAYETWGELTPERDNVVLLHTGLSASSHAHSQPDNTSPGWWEKFIGPGKAVDTTKFFVICTNVLGGCYGTTGPSSINPETGERYATRFPIITVEDMVRVQFKLLDAMGIDKLHASVGSSLGGMQSLMAAQLFPDRVGRVVSISAAARSHPFSIAMRYVQRRVLMSDPNWQGGCYYDKKFPFVGMKFAREIAFITYRSGPEWEERFGRKREDEQRLHNFCPDYLIETYLDRQGEQYCLKYDPNSFLYISKAMDMFDLSEGHSSLVEGMSNIQQPALVIGVQSDILFPVTQQQEIASTLKKAGNKQVTYYELDALYGHDTFLLDVYNVGAAVKGHLQHDLSSL